MESATITKHTTSYGFTFKTGQFIKSQTKAINITLKTFEILRPLQLHLAPIGFEMNDVATWILNSLMNAHKPVATLAL